MTADRGVVFVSGVRTAIGTFGGSLKNHKPTTLGSAVIREAVSRSGVAPETVGSVVFGNVLQTNTRDPYLARIAALDGGLPIHTPAFTVNRLCGSGFQAIVSAAQQILLGDVDTAIAGGAECMSQASYLVPAQRWGQKMGDAPMVDTLLGALNDPFGNGHMGITAENVATKFQVTRGQQDKFALNSQEKALKAQKENKFKDEIINFKIKSKKSEIDFNKDEHPRDGISMEALTRLKPVFKKDGTVTAGNASGINDGAAAVTLMTSAEAEKRGLKKLVTIKSWASCGVDPALMGTGPIPSSKKALDLAGWLVKDLDLLEVNEAFAAQSIAVLKTLGIPEEKVNVNGGAIAIGHPIGASGTRILVTLIHEMIKRDAHKGLATLCIGGGMGIAMCVER